MLLYTESLQLFTRFIQFCRSLPFLRRLLLFQKQHDMLGDTGPAPAAPFSNYLEAKTYYDGTTDRPKASEAGAEGAAVSAEILTDQVSPLLPLGEAIKKTM